MEWQGGGGDLYREYRHDAVAFEIRRYYAVIGETYRRQTALQQDAPVTHVAMTPTDAEARSSAVCTRNRKASFTAHELN